MHTLSVSNCRLILVASLALLRIAAVASATVAHLNEPPAWCSDYEMLIVNTQQCVSRCPLRCVNGVCSEVGECPCEGHYVTSFEKGLVCAHDCLSGCKSAGGYCATADVCVCPKGRVFDAVGRRCRHGQHLHLFDLCSGRCLFGQCTGSGECICTQGYQRTSSLFGQLCTPICKQDCGPNGYCHLPNMCACRKKHHHYEADARCHKDSDHY